MTLQPDEKILFGGSDSTNQVFSLIRFNSSGTIDSTFGINGIVSVQKDSAYGGFNTLCVQADGKILTSENLQAYSSQLLRLWRFTSSGHIDSSFGQNGNIEVLNPFQGSAHRISYAHFIRTWLNGRILLGGLFYDGIGGSENLRTIACYMPDGSIDSSFGVNGLLSVIPIRDRITDIKISQDSKILVSNYSSGQVLRYLSSPNVGIIDFALDDSKLYIYPNPMCGSETLVYTLTTAESISISLLGMDGRLISTYAENEKQNAGEHKQPIVIPDSLPAGAYIISIASPSGKVAMRVVK